MYEEKNGPNPALLISLGVVFVSVLVVLFFTVARKPAKVEAPKTYAAYTSPDRTFLCQAPDGWEKKGAGTQGSSQGGAVFTKGTAKIDISSDEQGAIMGDMIEAQNRQASGMSGMGSEDMPEGTSMPGGVSPRPMPSPKPAVEQLHLQAEGGMKKKFKDYEEKPMQSLHSPLGESRFSEWTGTAGGMIGGGKVHGYRMTVLNNDRRITVRCQCAEQDWPALKPAFEKVITSLAPAGA